ncbi:translation elongation factor Ts [Candidatus Microgenomates bacterium]|nr:translation elongation factor Ts [Candidatus Microgenomates bacterium]
MVINIKDIKKLRGETSASVADCRLALSEAKGDYEKARAWLKKHGIEKAGKKEGRETSQGVVDTYIHSGDRVGVLLELLCETDFVAKTADFKNLSHELCMQIAAMKPADIDSLLKQEYIRDASLTIGDLIKSIIGKLGENIKVKRFERFEVGE